MVNYNPMNLKQILEDSEKEVIGEFIKEFCNDHNGEVRFLRGVFYDEKDGSEQIIKFISEKLRSHLQEAYKAGLERALELLPKEKEIGKIDEDAGYDLKYGFNQSLQFAKDNIKEELK